MERAALSRRPRRLLLRAVALLVPVLATACDRGPRPVGAEAKGARVTPTPAKTELATLGGGCFWCVEAVFLELDGVVSVTSGYAGGTAPNPTYEQVCTGRTGHAEVCRIEFDPAKVSYADLLEVFFKTHDPTTKNRQGPDTGTQYRSIVLTHDDRQREIAEAAKKALDESGEYGAPIVTEIAPLQAFHPAEEHHRDYYARNPGQAYCAFVIRPKLEKFRRLFRERLKKRP